MKYSHVIAVVVLVIGLCAWAPWMDTDEAMRKIRTRHGEDAVKLAADASVVPCGDGAPGVRKVPFGIQLGSENCVYQNGYRGSYMIWFWQ
ncbi:hypothetical protein HYS28_00770 [Candidatus Uhrbacteria bacterium]|nr:hypothetical protein [Candidatus Uhrbacteria bacterium]